MRNRDNFSGNHDRYSEKSKKKLDEFEREELEEKKKKQINRRSMKKDEE